MPFHLWSVRFCLVEYHCSAFFYKDAIVIFRTPAIFPSQTWHKEKYWMKLHDSIPCITLFVIAPNLIVIHSWYFHIFIWTHWKWYIRSFINIKTILKILHYFTCGSQNLVQINSNSLFDEMIKLWGKLVNFYSISFKLRIYHFQCVHINMWKYQEWTTIRFGAITKRVIQGIESLSFIPFFFFMSC